MYLLCLCGKEKAPFRGLGVNIATTIPHKFKPQSFILYNSYISNTKSTYN